MVDFLVIKEKHIKARYFFIKDKIEDVGLEVQCCPTQNMWTDILNKPEQGMKFRKDRAALMNVTVDYDDEIKRKKLVHCFYPERSKINGESMITC